MGGCKTVKVSGVEGVLTLLPEISFLCVFAVGLVLIITSSLVLHCRASMAPLACSWSTLQFQFVTEFTSECHP